MRKILLVLVFVFATGCFLAVNAGAALYTTPVSHLTDTTNYGYVSGAGTLNSTSGSGPVTFNITLGTGTGWKDIQIGDGFDLPYNNAGLATGFANMGSDFTGYTSYKLQISNPNTAPSFMANIYMNTGWTDIGETNVYYENGWVWINPGESKILTIDLTTVANLNHVSNIGFKVGANVTGDDGWNPYDWSNSFNVAVNPVPIPAAAWLLGSGLLGLVGFRRRFRK